MSPEWKKLADVVPGDLQQLVREELSRLDMEMSVWSQTGFAFVVVQQGNGQLVKIEELATLSPSQLADAKKSTSSRHVVLPLNGRSRHDKHNVNHGRLEQFRSSRSSR